MHSNAGNSSAGASISALRIPLGNTIQCAFHNFVKVWKCKQEHGREKQSPLLLPMLCTYNSVILFFRCSLILEDELKTSSNNGVGVANLCLFNVKHPFKFGPIFPQLFWKYMGVCLPTSKGAE